MLPMKVLVVLLVVLAGCGSGSETPACPPPLVGSCTNHTGLFCTEYSGVPTPGPEVLMSRCKGDPDEPDVWSTSGCSHSGALGACKNMQQGLCVAVWLKLPPGSATREQAVSMCAAQGGTWVDP
jgi:hypothetical protein